MQYYTIQYEPPRNSIYGGKVKVAAYATTGDKMEFQHYLKQIIKAFEGKEVRWFTAIEVKIDDKTGEQNCSILAQNWREPPAHLELNIAAKQAAEKARVIKRVNKSVGAKAVYNFNTQGEVAVKAAVPPEMGLNWGNFPGDNQ